MTPGTQHPTRTALNACASGQHGHWPSGSGAETGSRGSSGTRHPCTCWTAESQDQGQAAPPTARPGLLRVLWGRWPTWGTREQTGNTSQLVWARKEPSNATGLGAGVSSTSAHRRARLARCSRPTTPGSQAHGSRVHTRTPRPTPLQAVPPEPWSAWVPVGAETPEGATSCP